MDFIMNDIATLPNVEDMAEGRTQAIEIYRTAFSNFRNSVKKAQEVCVGGNIDLDDVLKLLQSKEDTVYEWAGGKQVKVSTEEKFMSTVTTNIDRQCWTHLHRVMGAEKVMDRQAKEEWHQSLRDTPPEFSADNCRATFGNLWANRRDIYLRGIANIFTGLDRRFRSHDAFAWGNRLIINNALGDSGVWWDDYRKRDILSDVERTMAELDGFDINSLQDWDYNRQRRAEKDGSPIPQMDQLPIVRAICAAASRDGLPTMVEGRYFKVKIFKNKNLHIWFTRKDLLSQVNDLLLEYFKPLEGEAPEPDRSHSPDYIKTPAKNYGFFPTPSPLVKTINKYTNFYKGERVLEPSSGTGSLLSIPYDTGCECDAIELQPHLVEHLKNNYPDAKVKQADFLNEQPTALYDAVIMNPPFDRGRDIDHVRHAYKFLRAGGRLYALMSASAEHSQTSRAKALHRIVEQSETCWGNMKWIDMPERSFADQGTNVNVVLLAIKKPL